MAIAAMNTSVGPDTPATVLWTRPGTGLLARIAAAMQEHSAHPARTLVLLPYAQLLGLARGLWALVTALA
jgi:ATP-dependent helicase/nuclease subunit B